MTAKQLSLGVCGILVWLIVASSLVSAEWFIDQGGVTVKVRKPKVATDLNTHYVLAGISFRF